MKRYAELITYHGLGRTSMEGLVEDDLGRYVLYSDVQSIQAENYRLNAEATADAELIKRLNASLAEALAERDRLREALYSVSTAGHDPTETIEWIRCIARKALEGEGK